jgi:hypothetical protein
VNLNLSARPYIDETGKNTSRACIPSSGAPLSAGRAREPGRGEMASAGQVTEVRMVDGILVIHRNHRARAVHLRMPERASTSSQQELSGYPTRGRWTPSALRQAKDADRPGMESTTTAPADWLVIPRPRWWEKERRRSVSSALAFTSQRKGAGRGRPGRLLRRRKCKIPPPPVRPHVLFRTPAHV